MAGSLAPAFAALGLALIAGCASPSLTVMDNHRGRMRALPRQERSYTHQGSQGQGYALRHLRAPQVPGHTTTAAGDGGELLGQVCGAELRLQVALRADHVELRGEVNQAPTLLRVSEHGGQRLVNGVIGERSISLALAEEGLWSGGALVQRPGPPLFSTLAALPAAPLGIVLPLGGCLGS